MAALAVAAGCVGPPPAPLPDPRLPAAVARAIPLLQSSAATWLTKRECTSCHHQALGTMAVAVAREAGFAVDEARAAKQIARILEDLTEDEDSLLDGTAAINGQFGCSYMLVALAARGVPAGRALQLVGHYVAGKQSPDGRWTSESKRPPLMQLLLDRGADVEDQDDDGVSMLMYLAAIGYDEPARRLLARGADVAAVDNEGRTSLHYAAMCDPGHTRVVELLLAAGADPRATAKGGESPLDLARRHGNLGAVRLLAAAGPAAREPEAPAPLKGLLAAHNRVRAKHCAPPLAWSADLARTARRWADKLRASGCSLEHSRGAYGENLAAATPGSLANEDVVELWYAERERYRFDRPGFRSTTGHFTQVVWRGTKRVGCGVASCDAMQVWVCNYDPPGNVEGQYRENVLPESCSRR